MHEHAQHSDREISLSLSLCLAIHLHHFCMPCVNPLPRPVVEKNENRYGKMKSNNQNGKKGKRKLPMSQVEVALAACLPACLGSVCVSVLVCIYVCVRVCVAG